MTLNAAKALVRDFFYQDFLPSHLSDRLLRSGNHLVLLGAEQEEERLLARMGVPGHRIYSVENDLEVFTRQSESVRRGDLDVALYYGELAEFVRHYLHTNQRFLVLNLDICGSYLNGIDSQPPTSKHADGPRQPIMTPILLFARRNPQTVIATYSTVGRDGAQLREGLKSLAICRRLAPGVTEWVADELFGRYRSAGLSPGLSFNMVLRHLFWVRSHMEHVLLGTVAAGKSSAQSVRRFLSDNDACWQQAVRSTGLPMTYESWLAAIDNQRQGRKQGPMLDLSIQSVTIATYRSTHNFYHTGWFTLYRRSQPLRPAEWLKQSLAALTAAPLRFPDRQVKRLDAITESQERVAGDLVIWSRNGLDHPGRQLAMPVPVPQLSVMDEPVVAPAAAVHPETELVIAEIRRLARSDRSLTTGQVLSRLTSPATLPRQSVTAHIAAARRKKPARR